MIIIKNEIGAFSEELTFEGLGAIYKIFILIINAETMTIMSELYFCRININIP